MQTTFRNANLTSTDEDSRTVQFVISDSSKDRHGSVLNINGWNLDNFNRNGIVGYQHEVYGGGMCKGADPDSVIGIGRAWVEESDNPVLMGEVKFEPKDINPLAEKVYKKVLHGTFRATSVGFSPIGGGIMRDEETGDEKEFDSPPRQIPDGKTFYYEAQELLEFSIVNIPSNPNALKRSLRDQTANALHFLRQALGEDIATKDINDMKVMDILRLLESGEQPDQKEANGPQDAATMQQDIARVLDNTNAKLQLNNKQLWQI